MQWLREFFTARTHQTRVGFSLSSVIQLLSGVVQGSGTGPLMFLSYINELAEILEVTGVIVKLFADDVKLYMQIVNSCDVAKLRRAFDLVTESAKAWQLSVSIQQCCILSIGRILPAASAEFHIDGHNISFVSSCRDLGVIVSHDLKPTAHIKQHQLIGVLMQFDVALCRAILIPLYVLSMCMFCLYLSSIL